MNSMQNLINGFTSLLSSNEWKILQAYDDEIIDKKVVVFEVQNMKRLNPSYDTYTIDFFIKGMVYQSDITNINEVNIFAEKLTKKVNTISLPQLKNASNCNIVFVAIDDYTIKSDGSLNEIEISGKLVVSDFLT